MRFFARKTTPTTRSPGKRRAKPKDQRDERREAVRAARMRVWASMHEATKGPPR